MLSRSTEAPAAGADVEEARQEWLKLKKHREQQAAWRARNPEKVKAYNKKYVERRRRLAARWLAFQEQQRQTREAL